MTCSAVGDGSLKILSADKGKPKGRMLDDHHGQRRADLPREESHGQKAKGSEDSSYLENCVCILGAE
ncbi:hypothetical protein P7K49_039062 [Saguinus oedipus]|uniref:Uncharacterized protein n=1 Tax=Saguinus oedipus TaxID=9490 RepID=A0ABQ9TGI5_SAGOE|nr:hypothetical protein P7K49_039062 [Saguinus oedipus]